MLHCLLMRMASGEQPVPAREIARMQRVVDTVSGPVP